MKHVTDVAAVPLPQVEDLPSLSSFQAEAEFFELVSAIPLETTAQSELRSIRDVLLFQDQWIVVDNQEPQVYRFSYDGHYLSKLGQKGNGPGEYLSAHHAYQWRDQVVISDAAAAALHFYDENGTFIRKITTFDQGVILPPNNYFNGDRCYAIDFTALNPNTPNHAIFDVTDESFRIIGGFGQRAFASVDRKKWGRSLAREWSAHAAVGNHLWLGSPYDADIHIYDMEGRHVKTLANRMDEGLTAEDLSKAQTFDQANQISFSKYANFKIFWIHPFVFTLSAKIGRYGILTQVYSEDGKLLVPRLKDGNVYHHLYESRTMGEMVIQWVWPNKKPGYWETGGSAEDYATFIQSGVNPEGFSEEGNPILLISRLKPSLTEGR